MNFILMKSVGVYQQQCTIFEASLEGEAPVQLVADCHTSSQVAP
jgi:hypothetical protein